MLHLHCRCPGTLSGLLLQSGSFFTADLDPQEGEFGGYRSITTFVEDVVTARVGCPPVPTVLTCGTVEENLANNRALTEALVRQGLDAQLFTVRDAHNYTAWRDSLHPHLTRLVKDALDAA
jgi:enterochelin esterase family protein